MIPPRKISKNKDLSDTAKNLWLPAALWGNANGKLFGTNLQFFLDAMAVNLNLPETKILEATEELIGCGLFHELLYETRKPHRNEGQQGDLLQTLRKINWERHNI